MCMSFLLDRNLEDFNYELYYNGQLLNRYTLLSSAMDEAQKKSKNNAEPLHITKACISDWYLGFPLNKEEKTISFNSPEGLTEKIKSSYRCVEGPFYSEKDAVTALRKISGQSL
jgi:hypothetical protein